MPKLVPDDVPKSAKVAYVKKAKQTRNHTCHWPGCGKQCKPAYWGCFGCWMKLPHYLREKIWATFQPGQEVTVTPSREYVKVAREVQEWIKVNYPPAPVCKACNDTGINSKGGACVPCVVNGGTK